MTTESNQADALDELNAALEARLEYCEWEGICIEDLED